MMYLTKADHSGRCFKCGEPYIRSEPLGVISVNSGKPITHYAHPTCWLELGLAMLGNREFTGGPEKQLTEEQQSVRKATLHHWAQLAYRERQIRVSHSGAKLEQMLARLEHAKDELRMKMVLLGGMPRSWKK